MVTLFNNLVKGLHLSDNCEIKHLIAYSFPCKLCNCLILRGGGISVIALILLGSNSIPHRDTMNPNNFPKVTPKTHFFELRQTLNSSNLLNIFISISRYCFLILDLANKSST